MVVNYYRYSANGGGNAFDNAAFAASVLTLLTLSMMLVAFLLLRYKVFTPAQAFEQLQPILPPCSLATTDHSAGAIAQPPLPYPLAISVRLLPLLCFFLRVDHFHPLYCGTHPIIHCGRVIVPRALPVVSARSLESVLCAAHLRLPSLAFFCLPLPCIP